MQAPDLRLTYEDMVGNREPTMPTYVNLRSGTTDYVYGSARAFWKRSLNSEEKRRQ